MNWYSARQVAMMILSSAVLKTRNKKPRPLAVICLLVSGLMMNGIQAEPADVLDVEVNDHGDNRFTFNVTVQHADTGWDHYADAWVIFTTDGKYLTARNLQHPHVAEQPFTRNLPNVPLPENINQVVIRAHCSKDGFAGREIIVQLR